MARRTASETQRNRERAPDFAAFKDELEKAFGKVSVLYVKFPDGEEVRTREYEILQRL